MTKLEPTAEEIERVARGICLSYGADPDDNADLVDICGPNNEPLVNWHLYEEQARAAILAMDRRASPAANAEAKHWAKLERETQHRLSMGGFNTKAQDLDLFEAEEAMKEAAIRSLDSPPAPAVAVPEGLQELQAWVASEQLALITTDPEFRPKHDTLRAVRKKIREVLAAAPQPPATRSYEEGIEAAAKWVEGGMVDLTGLLEAYPGDPTGQIAREIELLRARATALRSLADEPRHG